MLGGYAVNFTFTLREPEAAALDRRSAVINDLVAVPVMEVTMLMEAVEADDADHKDNG